MILNIAPRIIEQLVDECCYTISIKLLKVFGLDDDCNILEMSRVQAIKANRVDMADNIHDCLKLHFLVSITQIY